jgi:predicted transcriptional regulator
LAEEMDIKYDALRKTVTSLVKKGVIGIHKTGSKDNPNNIIKAITVKSIYIHKRK